MMSITTKYSFYVESNVEPQANLAPTFDVFKNVEDGSHLEVHPEIVNIGDGYYTFDYTWDETSPLAWLIKIDTGLINIGEKYITMKIERHDFLPETISSIETAASRIEAAATEIKTEADDLMLRVERLLDVEEGSWRIEGSQLKIYAPSDTAFANPIAIYDLFNQAGIPSGSNVYQRNINSLLNRGF